MHGFQQRFRQPSTSTRYILLTRKDFAQNLEDHSTETYKPIAYFALAINHFVRDEAIADLARLPWELLKDDREQSVTERNHLVAWWGSNPLPLVLLV